MRNWKTPFALLTLIGLAGMSAARTVTVTINRVKQVDDLDKSTFGFTKDRADFYVQIWINGKMFQSKVKSTDDGRPNWRFSRNVPANATIRIKLIDDDGGLERKDDFVDINPRKGKKDLNLVLNQKTGRISGDVSGARGKVIHAKGGGDSGQGEIWFTIR
jgi:hypothetical protein